MAAAAADHAGGCRPPGETEVGIAGWSWDTVQGNSKTPGSTVRGDRCTSRPLKFSPNTPQLLNTSQSIPEVCKQKNLGSAIAALAYKFETEEEGLV